MRVSRLSEITEMEDFFAFRAIANEMHERAHRLHPGPRDQTKLDPHVISELFNTARRLHLIGPFQNKASQLPFARHEQEIKAGKRSVTHTEAVQAIDLIKKTVDHFCNH